VSPTEIVLKVAEALERANIPFMIVGGFSNNVYGIERNTQDADFVIQLQVDGLNGLLPLLGPDFKTDPQLSFESLVAMGQYYVIKHLHPLFKIELFLAGDDAASREQFARRRKVVFHGQTLCFISPDDLVITKLRWYMHDKRRTKDFSDVCGVLAVQQGKLNMEHIRHWCGVYGTTELLEEALRAIPRLPDNPE
jgi:hypothetical protein